MRTASKRQNGTAMATRNIERSPQLKAITATQLPCLVLSALLLDGGRGLKICIAAIFAHWVCVGIICTRNQPSISPMDTFLIRWGFLPCLTVAIVIASSLF